MAGPNGLPVGYGKQWKVNRLAHIILPFNHTVGLNRGTVFEVINFEQTIR